MKQHIIFRSSEYVIIGTPEALWRFKQLSVVSEGPVVAAYYSDGEFFEEATFRTVEAALTAAIADNYDHEQIEVLS